MDITTLWPVALAMLATALFAGVVAGLLGIGGGIVVVPALEFALQFAGVPSEWRMHVAVATSLAIIIPTSISSARAHHARGAIDLALVRTWGPGMLLGALAGSLLATQVQARVLATMFGALALLVAVKMFLPLDHLRLARQAPTGLAGSAIGAAIGAVSAMMGIGGGTVSVPSMILLGTPIHRAIGTGALFGLLISLPGTLGYLSARPPDELPGATIGLVSLLGVVLIAPGSMLTAPLGARLAHALPKRVLSRLFGAFLLIVAARMLYRGLLAA
ncbi:MAG: sulfite exporter TauE/SafE family protein [Sinobacteraceae bacterium]|nr:sulfite exporter TauE/SafE family protein [Nevskiaceae bacterium]